MAFSLGFALVAGCALNFDVSSLPSRDGAHETTADARDAGDARDASEDSEAGPIDTPPVDVLRCPMGMEACAGVCVNLGSSVSHCGVCNNSCPTGARARPACNMGACAIECDMNFLDCDNNPRTGCEADSQNDRMHCGNCSTRCVGTMRCASGVCSAM